MLDCFDGLAALLTFDSVPGWKLGTMAWPLTQSRMDVWTDGWADLCGSVFSSGVCFLKGGNDEAEAPAQASVSALKAWEGAGECNADRGQRSEPCSYTLHTHSFCPGNCPGGGDIANCNHRSSRWPRGWGRRCRSSIRSLSRLGITDVIGTYGRIYCTDTVNMSMPLYKMS